MKPTLVSQGLQNAAPPGAKGPVVGTAAPAPPADRVVLAEESPADELPSPWRRAALAGLACLSGLVAAAPAAEGAPLPPSEVRTLEARPVARQEKPELRFQADGTFKILQLTDLHFQPEESAEYKQEYARTLETLLEAEKPDLVVLTGDVLYWSRRPMEEYFGPTLAPLVERGVPWAFAMGNHDVESWFTGEDLARHLQAQPYSVTAPGPAELGGTGNYAVEIRGREDGETDAVLYFLDSHDRPVRPIDDSRDLAPQFQGTHARPEIRVLEREHGSAAREAWEAVSGLDPSQMAQAWKGSVDVQGPSGRSFRVTREDFQPVEDHGYDWLTADQVKWYDGVSDDHTRRAGAPVPSLMFLHVPLPEYPAAWNNKAAGTRLEAESVQGRNTGMFATLAENRDVMGVFAGHDHVNDYVGWLDGVALGYGRKTGMSVYGPGPMQRGARVLQLHEGQKSFDTWIRTVDGEVEGRLTVPAHFTPR